MCHNIIVCSLYLTTNFFNFDAPLLSTSQPLLYPQLQHQTKMAKDDVEMADASAPAADAKKPAAKKGGPKKALQAPRFEIKKWNVSFTS